MRKDVRTGFAVGSILFVGILVYVLFFTGGTPQTDPRNQQANNATGSGGAGASNSNPGVTPVEPEPARPVTPVKPVVAETPKPPARVVEAQPEPARVAPPVEAPLAANPTTRPVANEATAADATPDARPIASATAFDWKAALNNGVTRALLGQSTTTPETTTPDRVTTAVPPTPAANDAAAPAAPVAMDYSRGNLQPEPQRDADPATPPSPSAPREYVLQKGDSFWSIAKAEYGDSRYFSHIVRANPRVNPAKIKVGDTIVLPPREQVVAGNVAAAQGANPTTRPVAAASASTGAPANPVTEYRVQNGDSLFTISKKLYGRGDRASKLYETNKELIGANPSALKKGMVLKLPEPPTTGAFAGGPTHN